MALVIPNTKNPLALYGDDFTGYSLGAFDFTKSQYTQAPNASFGSPLGTSFTIVNTVDGSKNSLAISFRNPSTASAIWLRNEAFTANGSLWNKVGYPLKYWFRARTGGGLNLFNTTSPIPIAPSGLFSGAKYFPVIEGILSGLGADFGIVRFYMLQNSGTLNWFPGVYVQQNLIANSFSGSDFLAPTWYRDGLIHDFILYFDASNPPLYKVKVWVDRTLLIDTDNSIRAKTTFKVGVPGPSGFQFNYYSTNTAGQASTPAEDIINLSLWELIDAATVYNPYLLIIDPVTQVFDTYETITNSYQFYDMNGLPVTLKFILPPGGTLPQCKFVDDSLVTLDTIPRIQGGDWIDITTDSGSLVDRFRYGDNGIPQTFVVDLRRGGINNIVVNRNKSNPHIHTTPNSSNKEDAKKWGVHING